MAAKKWTEEDEAACKIQKYVRRFLAKRQLAKKKKERTDYEELMDRLEKEVRSCDLVTFLLISILTGLGDKKSFNAVQTTKFASIIANSR